MREALLGWVRKAHPALLPGSVGKRPCGSQGASLDPGRWISAGLALSHPQPGFAQSGTQYPRSWSLGPFQSEVHAGSPPQAWQNFLRCLPPAETQASVIMTSSPATISMASCVRFSLPMICHTSAGGPDHTAWFCQCKRQLRTPSQPNSAIRCHMCT